VDLFWIWGHFDFFVKIKRQTSLNYFLNPDSCTLTWVYMFTILQFWSLCFISVFHAIISVVVTHKDAITFPAKKRMPLPFLLGNDFSLFVRFVVFINSTWMRRGDQPIFFCFFGWGFHEAYPLEGSCQTFQLHSDQLPHNTTADVSKTTHASFS
jgi:hypothetical protein